MRGFLHHIDLSVTDPSASFAIYDAVLGFLGYRLVRDFEWELSTGSGSSSLSLVKATACGTHDRYSPGLHHIAWRAESRADVDALHDLLGTTGFTVLDTPADYPQYNRGRGYYAVFFADPDGLKLEFVYTPL